MDFVFQPAKSNRLGEFLLENLKKDWPTFRAAIAFVKQSGTKHIKSVLEEYSKGGSSRLMVGINHHGTSKEGLEDLLGAVGAKGQIVVVHNPSAFTFHPKVYLFRSDSAAEVIIGSGNLTEGGLFTNYEASIRLTLNLSDEKDRAFLKQIEDTLDDWSDLKKGSARQLDGEFLAKLAARGIVPIEALAPKEAEAAEDEDDSGADDVEVEADQEPLFTGHSTPRAPSLASATRKGTTKPAPAVASATVPVTAAGNRGFVMTLQNTDVGKGQTTKGASARSPEIFIPLKARDTDPDFWGWPDKFVDSPTKYDREGVRMSFGGAQEISVNIMGWKLKKDLRLRHETLRSGGSVGDILRMEKAPEGTGLDYIVEIVKKGTSMHGVYLARCTEPVRNSFKTFGYY